MQSLEMSKCNIFFGGLSHGSPVYVSQTDPSLHEHVTVAAAALDRNTQPKSVILNHTKRPESFIHIENVKKKSKCTHTYRTIKWVEE